MTRSNAPMQRKCTELQSHRGSHNPPQHRMCQKERHWMIGFSEFSPITSPIPRFSSPTRQGKRERGRSRLAPTPAHLQSMGASPLPGSLTRESNCEVRPRLDVMACRRTIPRGASRGPQIVDDTQSQSHPHTHRFLGGFISVRQYRHPPSTALLSSSPCVPGVSPRPLPVGPPLRRAKAILLLAARHHGPPPRDRQENDDLVHLSKVQLAATCIQSNREPSPPFLVCSSATSPSWRPHQTITEQQHPSTRQIPTPVSRYWRT